MCLVMNGFLVSLSPLGKQWKWKSIFAQLGKHGSASLDHPIINGLVEHFNRVIEKNMHLLLVNGVSWKK